MPNVLLVVNNTGSLTNDDSWLQTRLTNLGYSVTLRNASASVDVASVEAVVLSRSCGSGTSDYSAITKPIVSFSRFTWQMLGWNGNAGDASANTANWTARSPAHPTHAGLGIGEHAMFSQAVLTAVPLSQPTSMAGRWRGGFDDTWTLFTFDQGNALLSSKTAGARQAGYSIANENQLQYFNATGINVVNATFNWAFEGVASATKLATPTNWQFTKSTGIRQLNGSWSPVSNAQGYSYEVERWTGSAWTAFLSNNTTSTSFTLTSTNGVDWNTLYRARVRANPTA
jgi:hypothetical protein